MKHISFMLLAGISLMLFSCGNNYGTKLTFGKGEVYYKNGDDKDAARKLGDWLKEFGYFNDTDAKSVQLDKKDNTYLVRFVVDKTKVNDEAKYGFEVIGHLIRDEVLGNEPATVELCDERFSTFHTIDIKDIEGMENESGMSH